MIIIVVGTIGSGKSLSLVKEIVTRKQNTLTNFELVGLPYTRLKYKHLITTEEKLEEGKRKPVKIQRLNYEFWQKQKQKGSMDIFLDEMHNILNSRRAMSKQNVLLSDFLSQIRKILGNSEKNNLYVISQKLKRIDVNLRDLAQMAIKCEKQVFNNILVTTEVNENGKIIKKKLPLTIIWKKYFRDADALEAHESFGINSYYKQTRFIGNYFFKYYNSYELIEMGNGEYL